MPSGPGGLGWQLVSAHNNNNPMQPSVPGSACWCSSKNEANANCIGKALEQGCGAKQKKGLGRERAGCKLSQYSCGRQAGPAGSCIQKSGSLFKSHEAYSRSTVTSQRDDYQSGFEGGGSRDRGKQRDPLTATERLIS